MSRQGRIHARPALIARSAPTGLQTLQVESAQESYLYVPSQYRFAEPMGLMLLLHGSGGHAHHGVELLQRLADEAGIILVAPTSHLYTWGESLSAHVSDVKTVSKALDQVFAAYSVDPARITIAGFSDGASFALALGLANGDLFKYVIAFSPRFALSTDPKEARNNPRVFISHGMRDEVMPISTCSQRVVRPLELAGLDVEYAEFEAGHRISPAVARQAFDWLTRASGSSREPRRAQSPEIQARQGG